MANMTITEILKDLPRRRHMFNEKVKEEESTKGKISRNDFLPTERKRKRRKRPSQY